MKKNTKMYSTAIAAALATSTLVSVIPTQAESVMFKDVDKSSEFYDNIINLAERGVVQGDGTGYFHPENEVRRDHAAKIIARILGLNTTDVVNPEFKDVPTNHPHYGDIAALKEAGIISGDGTGNYLPEKFLTRGEMAKIIANAFKLEVPAESPTPFTDVEGNFEQYITALYVNGVTKGVGNDKFNPSSKVTREQLAAFVVRAEKVAVSSLEETIERVLISATAKYNPDYTYAKAIVDTTNNVLKVEIEEGSTTLTQIKSDMASFEAANTVANILTSVSGIGTLYDNLVSITVNDGTYTKAELLEKENAENLITKFVEDKNEDKATTIGQLVGKETTVTVNFTENRSIQYKLKVVDEE